MRVGGAALCQPLRRSPSIFSATPTSFGTPSIVHIPSMWTPPSTWSTCPVVEARRSENRATARVRGRCGVVDVPAERGALAPGVLERAEPGDRLGRDRAHRARGDEVDPDALRPELLGEVAGERLEPRLCHAHPVVQRARRASRRSRGPTTEAPAVGARDLEQRAASRRSARRASRSRPAARSPTSSALAASIPWPRQSGGAYPMACSTPSSRPNRRVERVARGRELGRRR